MRKCLLVLLLLEMAVSMIALTGYSESGVFEINEQTLPVELSSFSAVTTSQQYVHLNWTSQSETNLLGYYLYRNLHPELNTAQVCSPLIQGTNSSSSQSYSYTDTEVLSGEMYHYWLYCLDLDGIGMYYGPVSVMVEATDTDGIPSKPPISGIVSVYPNPFNPSATVNYELDASGEIDIRIFNTKGQLLRVYKRIHANSGAYSLLFDGKDSKGSYLSSGVYLLFMKAGNSISQTKMVLMK